MSRGSWTERGGNLGNAGAGKGGGAWNKGGAGGKPKKSGKGDNNGWGKGPYNNNGFDNSPGTDANALPLQNNFNNAGRRTFDARKKRKQSK